MRLIDADALIEKMKQTSRFFDVVYDIEEMPTVDAVPVVRCKDCKYSKRWYMGKRLCSLWSEPGIGVFDDGFCNYGEMCGKEDTQE